MSDSVRSHRWQPTRLHHPWDSPGKNTGSGLPFPSPMHESEKWKWSRSVVSDSSWPHGLQPTRLLHPWDFPGKSTGVGCHCFLRKKKGRKVKNVGVWCVCIHFRVLGRHCLGWLRIVQASLSDVRGFWRLWVQQVVSQCSRNFSGTQNFMGLETGSSTEWLMLFLETSLI